MSKNDKQMGKIRYVRLDAETSERVNAWAEYMGLTCGAMIRFLARLGLERLAEQKTIRPPNEDHVNPR